jgi:SecD/SecF fusion protein
MKNKPFWYVVLSIFFAICLYNLYYSWARISTDAELNDKTSEQRGEWLKDEDRQAFYKTAVSNSMSLGLDLQGGMYITMEVGVDQVVSGLADNPPDTTFRRAIAVAKKKKQTSQRSYVSLFVESLREIDPKVKLSAYFAGSRTSLPYSASDGEVIAKLEKESTDAIDRTFNIIRTRIDQFGVTSPNLQKQPGTGRILIELPGVKDAARVRNLLRGTAKLEFWPTYSIQEVAPLLSRVNERVKQVRGLVKVDTTQKETAAEAAKTAADTVKKSLQDALKGTLADGQKDSSAVKDSLSVEEQKAKFVKENPFFGLFAGFNNNDGTSPTIGFANINDTAKINRILEMREVRDILPSDLRLLWTAKPEGKAGSELMSLVAIKSNRENRAPLSGDVIVDARRGFDESGKNPNVSMTMSSEGARIWKKMTTDYLQKYVAVVLDNQVYSYPRVNNVIPNGNSEISGSFTIEEASDLANILKAGKLPAPANIEGSETVGPTLGESTTQKGLFSFFLAFASVLAFLVLYYRGSGVVASIALILNLIMVLGVSSAFKVVLTLPGIAGIILSLAMAVDANVLVFERVREELNEGKSYKGAIQNGFQNALWAILDGNITTFITGLVLFFFGTGPIKGFAVTLMIGIITTLVAALVITRIMLEFLGDRTDKPNISFGNELANRFFRSVHLEVIGKRRIAYVISAVFVVVSIGSITLQGFKFGVDFLGGRQYTIELKDNISSERVEQVRKALTVAFDNNSPVVKTVSADNQLLVTTSYLYQDPNAEERVQEALLSGLNSALPDQNATILKSIQVSPTVAEDIKNSAYQSVVLSLLAMFLYVAIRFRRWEYGAGAIISLAFNVTLVLGLFSLLSGLALAFSVEIDQTFIAAVLTIVGYTINDTVVVFDRIRETVHGTTNKASLPGLYNRAINDTFSRTIVTSTTTLLTAAILFYFGGDVLKGFMLSLFWGIVVGTFSSVLIASPVSLDLILGRAKQGTPATPTPVRA